MKKTILILSFLIFTSPAHAVIYKWVDQKGALNFTDDYGKVPPDYRNSVEEVITPKRQPLPGSQAAVYAPSGQSKTEAPPIEQGLVREGFFATQMAEALKIGQAASEAEAESLLASVGITPRHGWIADYPLTPDIIGELQKAVGEAVDSGRLSMKKEEAMKAYRDLINQQGLPVRTDSGSPNASAEPPQNSSEYSNPEIINNYYYEQGPPAVTYYPPPQDYDYLYSYVPYPFWSSGFWFPGFFVLRDFHRVVFEHGRWARLTNHRIDPNTKRVSRIDPATREIGKHPSPATGGFTPRGFASPEAKKGASSIFTHSQERTTPRMTPVTRTRPERPVTPQRRSDASTFRGQVGPARPMVGYWMGRSQPWMGHPAMRGSPFSQRGGFGSGAGRTFARSFTPSGSGNLSGGIHGGGSLGSRGSSGGGGRGHH